MESTTTGATVAELKAKLPDSDATFREQCVEEGLTLGAACDRWMDRLRAALVTERAKNTTRAPQGNPVIASGGVPGNGRGGDARAAWDDAIREHTAKGKSFDEAARLVNRSDPALRQAMLTEHNERFGGRVPATV